MLRDNLVGLIEPMRSARELNPRALFTEQKKSSDDRPQDALKIPAPEGRNLTLTENAASPFHAEPRHPALEQTYCFVVEVLSERIHRLGSSSTFSGACGNLMLMGVRAPSTATVLRAISPP